jgi:hypothetical protein
VGALVGAAAAVALPRFSARQIISALNQQRASYGIPPLRFSQKLSAGCAAHNRYLIRNGASYLLSEFGHFEIPGRPGYTRAGDHAARTSVLAFGSNMAWQHGDPWNDAAFHIFQLLNPGIAVSGADERPMNLGGLYGNVNLECANTLGGPFRTGPPHLRIYSVPRTGQSIRAFQKNGEGQTVFDVAAGQPGPPLLFFYFLGRGVHSMQLRALSASLAGRPLPVIGAFVAGATGPASARQPPSLFASPEPAAVLTFPASQYHPPPGLTNLRVSLQVRPPGGRWVTERLDVTVKR